MVVARLREPIEVQVVGGDPGWLHILLVVTGPLLISLAAVMAAVVAAKTANRRQQAQLSHDLAVRREEDVRNVLDGAIEHVYETTKMLSDLEVRIESLESELLEGGGIGAGSEDNVARLGDAEYREIREAGTEVRDALIEMIGFTLRIELRLGKDDLVSKLHESLWELWNQECDLLFSALPKLRSEEQQTKVEKLEKELDDTQNKFFAACEARIRSGSSLTAASA